MRSSHFLSRPLSLLTLFCGLASLSFAAEDMPLPAPVKEGGRPLNETLKNRRTEREFSNRALTPQELSNLLWAANGLNREDGRRTAPSARNAQAIELYVILESGVYLYQDNKLKPVLGEDIRDIAGTQPFAAKAPVNILYVLDYSKQWEMPLDKRRQYGAVDSGFIGQNIYLHCASEEMITVFRGMIDAKALHKKLNLPDTKEILYGQSVGFPKNRK